MLDFLKQEANHTFTENGALTHSSTMSACLDLFATIGGMRNASDDEIICRFQRAWAESEDTAMKLLFYARDVRGGLGERRIFRTILRWMAEYRSESIRKNIAFISEFGRWDDILCLLNTPCHKDVIHLIRKQLEEDLAAMEQGENVSLLGKWLPSVNASSEETVRNAKTIARALGMQEKQYRQTLTSLREYIQILENNLRVMDYTFDYEKQPSKAMLKYRKAFIRNDSWRYREYLDAVAEGRARMHTGTLAPYDILAPIVNLLRCGYNRWFPINDAERRSLNTTWNAQEDFTGDENALVVMDGSGSMYTSDTPSPAAVALSLAIYFAERNRGRFHNHFITFSHRPQLVEIKGNDIVDKACCCASYNEVADTNLEAVFQLLLMTAVNNKLSQEQMPSSLYIISDMEFNVCTRNAGVTNFRNAQKLFREYGYELPQVVFWNVASRAQQVPVTMNEQGVTLVSGASPQIFQMLRSNTLTPYAFMLQVLGSERYAVIRA